MSVTNVGVILVHGIGEQKRFEHLDSHIRGLIFALKQRPETEVTTEIVPGEGAIYGAQQATWAAGGKPSIRIHTKTGKEKTCIHVHEVWWADVNEPYSIAKQVRFWLWGLSVWAIPDAPGRPDLPCFVAAMQPPKVPGLTKLQWLWVRAQLFWAGWFFLVAAFSLGVTFVCCNAYSEWLCRKLQMCLLITFLA